MIHHFERFGVENIMYALYDTVAWTNRVDFIMPLYDTEWHVTGMNANMLNLETGEYMGLSFAKQDFFNFMDELMAADTKNHPDLQKYYKLAKERLSTFKRFK